MTSCVVLVTSVHHGHHVPQDLATVVLFSHILLETFLITLTILTIFTILTMITMWHSVEDLASQQFSSFYLIVHLKQGHDLPAK